MNSPLLFENHPIICLNVVAHLGVDFTPPASVLAPCSILLKWVTESHDGQINCFKDELPQSRNQETKSNAERRNVFPSGTVPSQPRDDRRVSTISSFCVCNGETNLFLQAELRDITQQPRVPGHAGPVRTRNMSDNHISQRGLLLPPRQPAPRHTWRR